MAEEQQGRFDALGEGRARRRDEAEVEFNRIVAFSDGVFAIAITLLVLGLTIPGGADDLTRTLLNQQDDLLAYTISFAVIGRLWIAHHRFFAVLERFDGSLMGLNLMYLAFLVLIPFTSRVLGDYGGQRAAVILYALNMACVSLAFQAQIVYAYRRGLVWTEARDFERRMAGPPNFLVATVFVISIPVAFLSATVATLMWIAMFAVGGRLEDRAAKLRRGRGPGRA